MEQGWEAEVRLVVDAAYPSAKLIRALSDFMPKSRGCRVRLREEVLSGVEEVLKDGTADLAISGLDITGYLGSELSTVEFVAVAHADHALHQLGRKLRCAGPAEPDADRGARHRPASAARRRLAGRRTALDGGQSGYLSGLRQQRLGFAAAAPDRPRAGRRRAQTAATGPRQHSPAAVLSLH